MAGINKLPVICKKRCQIESPLRIERDSAIPIEKRTLIFQACDNASCRIPHLENEYLTDYLKLNGLACCHNLQSVTVCNEVYVDES